VGPPGSGAHRWYRITGSGFPAGLYPVFKLGWFAANDPGFLDETRVLLGSKDWINLRLTGELATDPSYASGSGLWDLSGGRWSRDVAEAAGVDPALLPRVLPVGDVVGALRAEPAEELGLAPGIPVATGGVDNSCMAAGSLNVEPGRMFLSLGSSSWAVHTDADPVIDDDARPYTFASLVDGLFDSALSSFSSGTALARVRRLLGGDAPLDDETFLSLAAAAEPGARGLTFLPMVAGGAPIEGGPHARGALIGLDASHERRDVARAALEGTVFAVARAFRLLTTATGAVDEVVVTGGGSRAALVRQLYADVLGCAVVRTSIDQQAAALGAAATAFVATGAWSSIAELRRAHRVLERREPDAAAHGAYAAAAARFDRALSSQIPASTTEQEHRHD
jgi:xylulokinase